MKTLPNCLKCQHHVIDKRMDEVKPGVFEANVVHKCWLSAKEKMYMLTIREARLSKSPCGVEGKLYQENTNEQ